MISLFVNIYVDQDALFCKEVNFNNVYVAIYGKVL